MVSPLSEIKRSLAGIKYAALRAIHRGASYPREFDWDWNKAPADRITLVKQLVSRFPDCSYLEIGCFKDEPFREIDASS